MKREEIFERLSPPPGGLAALRARMDARPRRGYRFAPVALVAIAVVVVLVSRARSTDPVAAARRHGDAPQIALRLAPLPAEAAAIEDRDRGTTALAPVATKDPNVAFYWVGSTTFRD